LLFVALSRTDYDNIFILGDIEIPNKLSDREITTVLEIDRLERDCRLQLSYDTLEPLENGFTIVYQNVNSYNKKCRHIMADAWYTRADVLIFSEANVSTLTDSAKIPATFKVLFPREEDNFTSNRNRGLLILVKENARLVNLSPLSIREEERTGSHVDLRSFEIDNHFVITGYKAPRTSSQFLRNCLQDIMDNAPKNYHITLIGDFNYDVRAKSEEFRSKILDIQLPHSFTAADFENQLAEGDVTTLRATQIDVVFSTSKQGYGSIYPAYFGDHYPVFYRSFTTNRQKDINKERKEHNEFIEKLKAAREKKDGKAREKAERIQNVTVRKSERIPNKSDDKQPQQPKLRQQQPIPQPPQKPKSRQQQPMQQPPQQQQKQLQLHIKANQLDFVNKIQLEMTHGDQTGLFKFKNLCAFNSSIHGYMNAYRNDKMMKQFVESNVEKTLSPLLIKLINAKQTEKNETWMRFLLETYKINNFKMLDNTFSYNMELSIIDIYGKFSLLGNYNSYTLQLACDECTYTSQIVNSIAHLFYANINSFVDLAAEIQNTIIEGAGKICYGCRKGAVTSTVTFNKLVVITVDAGGESFDLKLPVKDVPEEIVLPQCNSQFAIEYKLYRLQFIQNFFSSHELSGEKDKDGNIPMKDFKRRANEEHHYSSICSFKNCYHEYDDILATTRCIDYSTLINPTSMSYLEVTEEELKISFLFWDMIDERRQQKYLVKMHYNLDRYNSILHGLLRLFRKSKHFQMIVKNHSTVKIFSIIPILLENTLSYTEKIEMWLKALRDHSYINTLLDNDQIPIFDLDLISKSFFSNYESYQQICQKHATRTGIPVISLTIQDKRNVKFQEIIENELNRPNEEGICNQCTGHRVVLSDLLIISVSGLNFINDIESGPQMTVEGIPEYIELQNECFKKVFHIHFEMYSRANTFFLTQYHLGKKHYLEISEDHRARIKESSDLANPKIMVYIRHSKQQLNKRQPRVARVKPKPKSTANEFLENIEIYRLFDNEFMGNIDQHDGKGIASRHVSNMCPQNSIMHGLYYAFIKNSRFQQILLEDLNINLITLFRKIQVSRDINECHNHWLQYLYNIEYFKNKINENFGNMHGGMDVIEHFLDPYVSVFFKCVVCNTIRVTGVNNRQGDYALIVDIQDKTTPIEQQIYRKVESLARKQKKCSSCNDDTAKLNINKFLCITLTGATFEMNGITPELTFEQLPKLLNINNNMYSLLFGVHHLPSNDGTSHFITQYYKGNL
jgi:hypothetical protein